MSGPSYIGQPELEAQYTARVVRGMFCDDGSTTPGPRLARCCAAASRQADAILLKAWTSDQIPTLVADDEAVQTAVCRLAMAIGGDGRPEWTGDGAPFNGAAKDARAELELLAKAQLRSRAEATAGSNPNVRGTVASPETPAFMFSPSRNRPKPGGF